VQFLLQSDDVSSMEKRAIRHFSMIRDGVDIQNTTLVDMDDVSADSIACPVGTVEFVKACLKRHGLKVPAAMSYPDCLREFLCRNIAAGEARDARPDQFIKPLLRVKAFTGSIKGNLTEIVNEGCRVWMSDPVAFVAEYRYYIVNGRIVGRGRYDDLDGDTDVDPVVVERAVAIMTEDGAPAGYALDFGVLDDGRTALVEMNDGWALGLYRGSVRPCDYAQLLYARWIEILSSASCIQFESRV